MYKTAKSHKQFLNTNFTVPVIHRDQLPQLFTAPPISEEAS